ncbi:MAG TPA: PQQ-dependent sugar dehydrogenase [Thermoanaerobaculia bacterium]|nr:PQQ-dependent sugar dehydrogenase [Thermoanaerobaculia bacterium]
MNRRVLLALSTTLLLFATSLPQSTAQTSDPETSKAPFTPSGGVQGVSLEQVATDVGPITGIASAGDARLFLTLRGGRILIFENGAVRPQDFLSIGSLINANGFERGLLSVAFHPEYAQNGFFFVNYTNVNGDTVVARYQVSSDPNVGDASSGRVLLTIPQPFANHNGGQLQFGPDGYLYIGMGDGGDAFDPGCRAQKTDTLLGKMLRIDVDQNVNSAPFYGIPQDNPFRGGGDPPDEVWASGFRNPWRFSFDRQTGDLWIGDVGQNQREEIDFQPANSNGGENYGWKVMEGTLCTNNTNACPGSTPACNSAAFTEPVLEYAHTTGCSVTGGYVYRGNRLAQLRGSYIFGDFCSGEVWAAERQGNGFRVRTISGNAGQLSTFGEDAQGELYAATLGGRLFRITGQSTGGGKAETVGLYNPQSTLFQLKAANTAAAAVRPFRFGPQRQDWIPIAGDWNGDGKTTVGFYEQKTGIFRLKNTPTGRAADITLRVDAPSDEALPIAGDWDGDGDDTVGLFDPDTGNFLLKNSLTGSGFDSTREFEDVAGANLLPIAGDWNGDGIDTVGLFDPRDSIFYLANGQELKPDLQIQFGPRGRNSLPVVGDWNGDGTDGLGVYDPASATFRLRNAVSAGNPDIMFRFGPRRGGWIPVAGAW